MRSKRPPADPGYLRTSSKRLQVGVGSAITLDSEAAAEVAEWRAKARFLLRAQAPISALETLRLQDGQFIRLGRHLARLQRTTQHFGIKFSSAELRRQLDALSQAQGPGSWRVRITVSPQGAVQTQCFSLPATPSCVILALAPSPIDTQGPGAEFIQHKTTRREAYEFFSSTKPAQAFDVLLWNADEELTECSFGNVALKIDGRWLTPRLEAGLLPGVYREELLQLGTLSEARLLKSDLARAQELAFFNSLRGWCPASLWAADDVHA